MKILIAADGSIYTTRMLAHLDMQDVWLRGEHRYTVLHCVEPLPPRAGAYLDADARRRYYASESELVFEPIRTFFKHHGVDVNFVSQVGSPAEVIATMADGGNFDLVVMGSHGHGALAGLLMGSVATKVLALSKTPVLLVR
ncbi:universal stress protein [Variovorax sp. RA8]|uniref:universal stress protein n=1 Tax=Variovorax sp. (strain JCM 16519 / RA8) TaxID=662548 RepID=UPI000AC8BC04|nr:universal stress protein [Variovorax sp. RA8]VTU25597.1 Universal stress protein family protein [Variovorax sp. RA8]